MKNQSPRSAKAYHNTLRPSLRRLEGRPAIVTGGGQGIGAAIAEVFAHEGALVEVWDVQGQRRTEVSERLKRQGVSIVDVDITDVKRVNLALARTIAAHGPPAILVNNARRSFRGDLFSQTLDQWAEETELLVQSVFHLSQRCIAEMAKKRRGVILNISSVASFLTTPETPAYHAAKGAIEGMTRYLACQAGPLGVRVNALCPGHVLKEEDVLRSRHWRGLIEKIVPLRRVPTAMEIGYSALMLCSDDASIITGQSILVDGGLALVEHAYLLRQAGLGAGRKIRRP